MKSRHQSLHESINNFDELVSLNSCIDRSKLIKNAESPIPGLADTIKNYFSNHVDKQNPASSIMNIMAPGLIKLMIGGPLGWIVGAVLSAFNIDFSSIINSIWDRLKSSISGNKPTTTGAVDSAVDSTINSLETKASYKNDEIYKEAGFFGNLTKNKLSTLLKWLFKLALTSVGLLVTGDVINKTLGRPNALDNSIQNGHPVGNSGGPTPSAHTSTQTKFKVNSGYSDATQPQPWTVSIVNNESSISNLLVNFAKEVYSDLDGLESKIKSSPQFELVKDAIVWSNNDASGDNLVFIPKVFTSKKQLVDFFIDDVAKSV